jgi:hypothetical protein
MPDNSPGLFWSFESGPGASHRRVAFCMPARRQIEETMGTFLEHGAAAAAHAQQPIGVCRRVLALAVDGLNLGSFVDRQALDHIIQADAALQRAGREIQAAQIAIAKSQHWLTYPEEMNIIYNTTKPADEGDDAEGDGDQLQPA